MFSDLLRQIFLYVYVRSLRITVIVLPQHLLSSSSQKLHHKKLHHKNYIRKNYITKTTSEKNYITKNSSQKVHHKKFITKSTSQKLHQKKNYITKNYITKTLPQKLLIFFFKFDFCTRWVSTLLGLASTTRQ